MRLLRLLLCLTAALCAVPSLSLAEDAPPPPAGQGAQQPPAAPAPAPAPPAAPAPKAARNEEEDETAGLFKRLKAHVKGTTAMADEVATLQAKNAKLAARIQELENGAELKALRDENEKMRADIAAFIQFAQTHGLDTGTGKAATPPPQSPMGQAAGQAVASAVSTQLATLGVPAATLPPANPGTSGQAATLADVEAQLAAARTPVEKQEILQKNKALILASN